MSNSRHICPSIYWRRLTPLCAYVDLLRWIWPDCAIPPNLAARHKWGMEAKHGARASQPTLFERALVYSMVAASCVAFILVLAAHTILAPLHRR